MNITYNRGDLEALSEIARLRDRAQRRGMRLLEKTHPFTYWPGSQWSLPPGELDHVVAAEHLRVWEVAVGDSGGDAARAACVAEARVLGWPEFEGDAAKDDWVGKYSDHGGVWVEVG